MYQPVDYPVPDDSRATLDSDEITYAALLELHAAQQPITDAMIERARQQMEAAQQLPLAKTPQTIEHETATAAPLAPVLSTWRKVIRQDIS